jgi:exodeoxyribonuclease-3
MKLATWNVNSLRVRLPQLRDWLAASAPDIVCLQETKCDDALFPAADIEAMGYHAVWHGQKTYNGVAILSRTPLSDVVTGIDGYDDAQCRVIAASTAGLRIVSAYVPNGQALDSEKYRYKLDWLAAFRGGVAGALHTYPALAVLGDFNVAPEDRDVHDPRAWEGQVLVSEAERAAFRAFLALGLHDAFRLFDQPPKTFSWWDYRMLGFQRNAGLRIDHILLSPTLARRAVSCVVDRAPRKLERPSDHAPVLLALGT